MLKNSINLIIVLVILSFPVFSQLPDYDGLGAKEHFSESYRVKASTVVSGDNEVLTVDQRVQQPLISRREGGVAKSPGEIQKVHSYFGEVSAAQQSFIKGVKSGKLNISEVVGEGIRVEEELVMNYNFCNIITGKSVTSWKGQVLTNRISKDGRKDLSVEISRGGILQSDHTYFYDARVKIPPAKMSHQNNEPHSLVAGNYVSIFGTFIHSIAQCMKEGKSENEISGSHYLFDSSYVEVLKSGRKREKFKYNSVGSINTDISLIVIEENALKDVCVQIGMKRDDNAKRIMSSIATQNNISFKMSDMDFAEVKSYFLQYGILVNQTCAHYAARLVRDIIVTE